jgi:broad specificity phosphatase PhoE
MKYILIAMVLVTASCSSNKYFIVRHAEKATLTKDSAGMMASNPPLSEPGKVRSFVLRDELKDDNITAIYSTNTVRTTTTAEPLRAELGLTTQLYSPARDSVQLFIDRLKTLKRNVLIVGHSNTVDDLVNRLTGRSDVPGDLADSEYDNLFIVTKKGKKWLFERRKYGYPSNP